MAGETQILKVLDAVDLRLDNIKEVNGYHTTMIAKERATLKPFQAYDLPAINYWLTSLTNDSGEYSHDNRAFVLNVEYHSKTRDEPFVDIAEKLASDVVVALQRSAVAPLVTDGESPDLGGLVEDLSLAGYDYEIGEGQAPWCGVLVRFNISFYAAKNNMTTIGV